HARAGGVDARRRPQRAPELGSRRAAHHIRIHAHGNQADLVDAGRRFQRPAVDYRRAERVSELVAEIVAWRSRRFFLRQVVSNPAIFGNLASPLGVYMYLSDPKPGSK